MDRGKMPSGGRGVCPGVWWRDPASDAQFQAEAVRRSVDPEVKARMRAREGLPAAKERQTIVDTVKGSKVSLIVGDTGCWEDHPGAWPLDPH